MTEAVLVALAICVASAMAEGLLAGRGVTGRFAELILPRFSPPVWAWAMIGLVYYVVCFVVLHHLLNQPVRGPLWLFTFASVLALMGANAGWNYVFFRWKDLRASFTYTFCSGTEPP